MPKHFRRKKRGSSAPHKYRINKTKNYTYFNPEDVKAKVTSIYFVLHFSFN